MAHPSFTNSPSSAGDKMSAYADLKLLRKALYGQILSATAKRTGERVVLKKLLRECVERQLIVSDLQKASGRRPQPMLEDARRELEVLSRLNRDGGHRSVVRLIEGFETENDLVMVMEQLHSDLFDVVMDGGRLHESSAQRYFLDAVGGLEFIHSHDIAHRDLSLENLLLGSDGRVVISDFGLCCDCAAGEMQLDKVGKGFYIAPEIYADAGAYDAKKADIWSLGIILFIMMTGNPPMERPSQKDKRFGMIKQGKMADMLRQWQMLSYFSEDCLDLLSKMMCVDPTKRISLGQVMCHPWVKNGLQRESPRWVGDERISCSTNGPELDEVVKRLAMLDTESADEAARSA